MNNRTFALSRLDRALIIVIAALGALTLCALPLAPLVSPPAEDAVILFQFSRNLAHSGAITFIPSGPHAEGATDFAWMVIISLGMKLGIGPFWLVEILNITALIGIAALLLKIAGKQLKLLPILFIVGAFALMPQVFSAALGFSTYPFACLLILLAYYFLKQNDVALPLTALFLCLFRPDGIVFAAPLLIAALLQYPDKLRRLLLDALLFILPGLAYFVWRWHYFGLMFPLPFLVKSDTPRLFHLVVASSVLDGRNLCYFSAIILTFALLGRMGVARNRAILLCLVILPNFFYFAMRLDQDIAFRFFIYLPAGTAVLIAMNWEALRPQLPLLLKLSLAAWLFFLVKTWFYDEQWFASNRPEQAKVIADDLAKLPKGTLITTEAGELPYYSQWPSYDAWGLNTPAFAKRLFQPSDVAAIHPDLILVFIYDPINCIPQQDWHPPYAKRTWLNLTRNIVTGADSTQYELLVSPVASTRYRMDNRLATWQVDQYCWFVRRDSPLHSDIDNVLTRHGGIPVAQYFKLNSPDTTATTSERNAGKINPPRSIIRRLLGRSRRFVWDNLPG